VRLQGRTALVVGGGRGIGRAIALAFAREGADVAVAARSIAQVRDVADRVQAMGRRSLALQVNVTELSQVETMVSTVLLEFGRLDILVNSAGISIHAPVEEIRTEDWLRTLSVNLTGPFFCCRAVLPHMLARSSGRIITIGSLASKRGVPRLGAYSASKFGVLGFSEALAREVKAHGIRVNVICPGPVASEMRARNYPNEDPATIASPEEVAELAVFLASDEGHVFSGAALEVLEP
jgi:NAD(P)-dependent dehydrogenase (short-subunit alcohol dehydrogenase family)